MSKPTHTSHFQPVLDFVIYETTQMGQMMDEPPLAFVEYGTTQQITSFDPRFVNSTWWEKSAKKNLQKSFSF